MNINITSTEEFIKALRENPEFLAAARREILTQELLELPGRFASYSKRTDERLDRMDVRFDGIDARFDSIDARLDGIDARLDGMDRELGQVKGIAFGLDIDRTGLPKMVSEFGLRRTRIVRLAENNRASEDFNDAVWDALDNDTITRAQYDRLIVTDMIVRGRLGRVTDTYAYIVAEASYTLEQEDLEKVRASRDAIRKVFPDVPVFACLYGVVIPDDLRTSAESDSMKVFIEDELAAHSSS